MNPQPNLVDGAIELLNSQVAGSLATQSVKHPGFPFVSSTPFAVDENGYPVFFLSSMATHTKNLKQNPKASLLASGGSGQFSDARLTVVGNLELVPDADLAVAEHNYFDRHPEAQQWASFGDFSFYRLVPVDLYFVAGFGSMGWISAEEYSMTVQELD